MENCEILVAMFFTISNIYISYFVEGHIVTISTKSFLIF